MKPRGTSPQKLKKRRAIALAALIDLWRSGSALGGPGGALEGPQELRKSQYIDKPDQPHSGRYVIVYRL